MGPSALSFSLLVGAVTGAVVALTARTWNVARLKNTRRVLTLTASEVMVVVTLLAAVNVQQDFYTSWADLYADATGSAADYLVKPPHYDVTTGRGRFVRWRGSYRVVRAEQLRQIDRAVAAGARAAADHRGHGVVLPLTFSGERSHYALQGRVYLPASYFDPTTPHRRFPVVEFFSGFPSNIDIPFARLDIHRTFDELIAQHKMPPTILVVPEQNPRPTRDSACVDSPREGAMVDTYLAEDVPDIVLYGLRAAADRRQWALMGFSTGGYCALNLALRHSSRFGYAVSLSGNVDPDIDNSTGDLFGRDRGLLAANEPLHTVVSGRHLPLRFCLFTAMGDVGARHDVERFVPRVHPPDSVTFLEKPQGGHNGSVWRWALPRVLHWLGQAMPRLPDGPQALSEPDGLGDETVRSGADGSIGAAARVTG